MRLGRESVILIAVPLLLLAGAFTLLMPGDGRDAGTLRTDVSTDVDLSAEGQPPSDPTPRRTDSRRSDVRAGGPERGTDPEHPGGHPAAATQQRPAGHNEPSPPRNRAEYPRRRSFRGRVVDSNGQPVHEPVIIVNERRNLFSDGGRPFHEPAAEVVTVAPDGSFEIPRREGHVYVIHVQAEGYARTSVNLYATNGSLVTLARSSAVTGKITDALTHQRLPGASVMLQMGITSPPVHATTDERGEFQITGIAPGDGYLEVSHPQYKSQRIHVSLEPELHSVKSVSLTPGGHLEGTVTVAAGGPADVPVLVTAYDRFRMQSAGQVNVAPDGGFSFDSLYPGGQYVLTATAPGYGAATATVNLPLMGPAAPVALVLDDAWILQGIVLDSFGTPLQNCRIEVATVTTSADEPVVVHTNELGGFLVSGLGAHAYRLTASHPEHAPEEILPVTRPLHEEGVQINLQAGGRVTADIADPAGNPVMAALVRVEVTAPDGRRIGPRLFGYTTSQGSFRMDHVPLGNVSVRVFAAGFGPYADQFLLSGEGATVHREITLIPE